MKHGYNYLAERQSDRIILIPYAEKANANTGVNIANNHKRQEIYMKNCCVSACSAKLIMRSVMLRLLLI